MVGYLWSACKLKIEKAILLKVLEPQKSLHLQRNGTLPQAKSNYDTHIFFCFRWIAQFNVVTYSVHPWEEQIELYHVKQHDQLNFQASLPCQHLESIKERDFRDNYTWSYYPKKENILIIFVWKGRSKKDTSISLKSAPPTPMMRIDSGRSDAFTKASFVSCRSVTTPS